MPSRPDIFFSTWSDLITTQFVLNRFKSLDKLSAFISSLSTRKIFFTPREAKPKVIALPTPPAPNTRIVPGALLPKWKL